MMIVKMRKTLNINDTDLLEAYLRQDSKLLVQYMIKYGEEAIIKKLMTSTATAMKNAWKLSKIIASEVEQLELFDNKELQIESVEFKIGMDEKPEPQINAAE